MSGIVVPIVIVNHVHLSLGKAFYVLCTFMLCV